MSSAAHHIYNMPHNINPIHIPLALSNNVSKARNLVSCPFLFDTFIHIGKWTVENDLVCYFNGFYWIITQRMKEIVDVCSLVCEE